MKFGRRQIEQSEDIQMAPLIDIVFITLVFFMSTGIYAGIEKEIDVTLPTASNAVPLERTRGEIYINLLKDGRIVLNNREMTLTELQEVLNRVAAYFPGGAVIVRGDRDANLGTAIAILNCCKNADIQNVMFAATDVDKEPPK
ncbi:MAG: biopolymer transporter ExbD [Candidatus Hydrogenedentes bacterium]|nr:biopolymer transporter ExbD [Candidatus Hydrogenedentota bacterium]